jgi:voltage-dependent potassium channel beta subunit
MQYRNLGRSGLKVSEISLGSYFSYGGAVERDVAFQTIDAAYGLGVNFFDTANAYDLGEAEKVLGQALAKYDRSSYVLATKVFFPMGDGPNDRGLSRKHIMEQLHGSLKRLGQDYVDLYYCHRYDSSAPLDETLRAFDDLVRQGKVLYVGVSEWSPAQIEEGMRVADRYLLDRIVANQPQYSMLNRKIEEGGMLETCAKHGVGQVAFQPLAQGVLTGKYRSARDFPAGSRAANDKINIHIKRYFTDEIIGKVQKLGSMADRLGISMAQLALAWALRRPEVSSALIGASRPEQIRENAKASGIALPADILKEIDELFPGAV